MFVSDMHEWVLLLCLHVVLHVNDNSRFTATGVPVMRVSASFIPRYSTQYALQVRALPQ